MKNTKLKKRDQNESIGFNNNSIKKYCKVTVPTDKVTLNNEHRDYKWITQPTPTLHSYLIEMIKTARIFE